MSEIRSGVRKDADLHISNFATFSTNMSYTSLTYHLIFGTKKRVGSIDADHERELYKYIFDFATARGAKIFRIGGMPDHIHILCNIPPKISVSDFVKLIKSESSKFMKVNPHFPKWIGWAERYGALSVDASLREVRRQYIIHQKEHHRQKSFAEEFKQMLIEAGIDVSDIRDDDM